MKIIIGNDHAGVELKHHIITHLNALHIQVIDCGAFNKDSVDYPDYARLVSNEVLKDNESLGILICGTGIGMSIAANKFNGIRAALIYDVETASLAKAHNHANIICLGARKTKEEDVITMIDMFLKTEVETRHHKRIEKIKS